MTEMKDLDTDTLLKFAAAKLERYERERVKALSKERGWEVPEDADVSVLVAAMRERAND